MESLVPYFDRPISKLVVGSMALTFEDLDQSMAILDEYVRLGGNAVDTAHIYGPDRHKAVGAFLRERGRDSLVVMDKGCHPYRRNRVTRADMASDIAENQQRMGIDVTDFFVLHRDDPEIPVGEILEWLNEHVQLGRIKAFGASNWRNPRLREANDYASDHGMQGFSFSSPNLALAVPNEPMWADAYSVDREARDWYEQTGFPLFSWSSGAGGFFAGVNSDNVRRVYHGDENFARLQRATEVGGRLGLSATQVAVAWTLSQPMNVWAIVGPRTVEEVRENMEVLTVRLSPEELIYLELGN
jgi:aryl-alcohol dehydrogenase-like predicted oxidoreductase